MLWYAGIALLCVVILVAPFAVLIVRLIGWRHLLARRTNMSVHNSQIRRFVLFGDTTLYNEPLTGVSGCVAQALAALSERKTVRRIASRFGIDHINEQLMRDAGNNPENSLAVVSMGSAYTMRYVHDIREAGGLIDRIRLTWEFAVRFQNDYEVALLQVAAKYSEVTVMNIGMPNDFMLALLIKFVNMSIRRVCQHHRIPIIDVMQTFNSPEDYSGTFEPSALGSLKIVSGIHKVCAAGTDAFYTVRGSVPKTKVVFSDTPLYIAFKEKLHDPIYAGRREHWLRTFGLN